MKWRSLMIILLAAEQSVAISLNEYMGAVEKKNQYIASTDKSLKASEYKKEAGDIELSPYLFFQSNYTDDQKPPIIPGFGEKTITQAYTLGVNKKFATGTSASVSSSLAKSDVTGSIYNTGDPVKGSMAISMSQSLWKNSFGRSTDLRWQREEFVLKAEQAALYAQKELYLIQAEATFWDYWYQQEEIKIRQSSIERSKRLEAWSKKRLNNGIGDKSDVLQAQALVSTRDLQMLSSKDELVATRKKLLSYIDENQDRAYLKVEADFNKNRSLKEFLYAQGDRVISLEAWALYYQSKAKTIIAKEAKESVKPDLSLEASYATNAQNTDWANTANDSSQSERPTSVIGIKFSIPLGGDAKDGVRNSALFEAESSRLQAEKKLADSEVSWQELQRRYEELKKKIEISEKLAELQVAKLSREQQRLNQGRTTTAQVITFEQDADEAQLNLIKLKSELKKLETQARLFVGLKKDEI